MSAATAAPTADHAEAPAVKKPGLMTLIKALAVVSVLVLLQLVGVSMLMPSSEETGKIAEKLVAADAAHEAEEAEGSQAHTEHKATKEGATHDMREVKLGSYHVVTFNTDTGTSLNIDFELYGTVLAKEEPEFTHLFEANKVRLREQILVTLRGSEVADLSDPDLGLLKRQILEKTNRTLGKPLLSEAIFSKFSFIER
ncbi:MAG: flagellar basal body-associated FliL family protein [Bythopirellula sp.]|nr:flagellar basal body-associated FliL family protein [Bythopirellula sp.]